MTREDFWEQVYIAHVLYRNCEEAAAIADLSVVEWNKRFGPEANRAVPLPSRRDLESSLRKDRP